MSQNIGDDAINLNGHMRGAVRLPQGAVRVTDADEEVRSSFPIFKPICINQ